MKSNSSHQYGDVAQLVEQQAFNLRVKGSNPFIFTSPGGQVVTTLAKVSYFV